MIVFGIFNGFCFNQSKAGNRDTLTAVVMYGSDLLFPEGVSFSPIEAQNMRDSLIKLPYVNYDMLQWIDFYISLGEMTKGDVINLIDSLFSLNEIPYPMVNQLNVFLASHEFPAEITDQNKLDSALFDPNRFYGDLFQINTPFGYHSQISSLDTNVVLQLAGNKILQEYHSPLEKIVMTSPYGWRYGRWHRGVDLDLEVWDPIAAVFPGVVRFAKYYGGYGRVVIIRHCNGTETLYAHMHRIKVREGDVVNAGDIVGLGGSSGNSTGSHLHFEVRFKGKALNPRHFIDFKEKKLIAESITVVPTKDGFAAFPDGASFHTVKKGDTLYDICQYYGTPMNKVCELNGIQKSQYLWVGQKIRIL